MVYHENLWWKLVSYCSTVKLVIAPVVKQLWNKARGRAQAESFLTKSIDESADPLDTFIVLSDVIGQAARQWDDDREDHDLDFLVPIQ